MTFFKLSSLVLVASVLALSGCGKDEQNRTTQLQQNNQVVPGTYASEKCFKNKISSAVGADRFSTGEITFNADHTGSAHLRTFTDAACTVSAGADENYTFQNVSVEKIGGVSVLKLDQGGISPTWWIPMNISDNGAGYSLDVNDDGQSGPYLIVAPTEAQVADFGANPGQGVAFKKQ